MSTLFHALSNHYDEQEQAQQSQQSQPAPQVNPFAQQNPFSQQNSLMPPDFGFSAHNNQSPSPFGESDHGYSPLSPLSDSPQSLHQHSPFSSQFFASHSSNRSPFAAHQPQPQEQFDISDHCTFTSEPVVIEQFSCSICSSVLQDPVETSCCNNLFCRNCFSMIPSECPHCRSSRSRSQSNLPVQRIIHNLPVSCNLCSYETTAGEFEQHYKNCTKREKTCRKCSVVVKQDLLVEHVMEHHKQDVVDAFF
ncbi:hypothetical protein GEMRC1_001660 [Eukaryota sp. GEM-RC1]